MHGLIVLRFVFIVSLYGKKDAKRLQIVIFAYLPLYIFYRTREKEDVAKNIAKTSRKLKLRKT